MKATPAVYSEETGDNCENSEIDGTRIFTMDAQHTSTKTLTLKEIKIERKKAMKSSGKLVMPPRRR